MIDPTSHHRLGQASIELRARILNLHDAEIGGASATAFDLATAADQADRPRLRRFWLSVALLVQTELVRREAIYDGAVGGERTADALIADLRHLGVPDEQLRGCSVEELEDMLQRAHESLMRDPEAGD